MTSLIDHEAAELFERFDDWLEGRKLFSLLKQLPSREQDALLLRIADCTHEQIAQRLGVSRARAGQILAQGEATLRKKYLRLVKGERPFPKKAEHRTPHYTRVSSSAPPAPLDDAALRLNALFGPSSDGVWHAGSKTLLLCGHERGMHVRVFNSRSCLVGKFWWNKARSDSAILHLIENTGARG